MKSRWFLQIPLRRQLVIFLAIAVILATSVFAFFNNRLQRTVLEEEYENSTQAQLEAVRLGLEIGLEEENYASINTVINWAIENENLRFVIVTDSEEAVIASYPPEDSLTLQFVSGITEEISDSDSLFIKKGAWNSLLTGEGFIYMGFSTSYLKDIQNSMIRNLLTVLFFIVIASSLASVFLASSITQPLEELEKVTLKIADNDLDIRADEVNGSPEIRVVASSFNSMINQLLDTQEQRMSELDSFNKSLEEKNHSLTEALTTLEKQSELIKKEKERTEVALEELKEAQVQLVKSEKMASLGQLVAGIAHEVNTPVGAILSAIDEVERDYSVMLDYLIKIGHELSDEQKKQYKEACLFIITNRKDFSTIEIREEAKNIEKELSDENVNNSRYTSKILAQVGFTSKDIKDSIPLLKIALGGQIVESFHLLGMSQIHVRDIQIAISRIANLVKALKSYSHLDTHTLSETDLKEDINNTLIILHNKIKRAITVHKEYEDIPRIKCYPDMLNQVWTNLIHNAIQSMKGQGIITLRIKRHDKKNIRVEVEDNGPGIPDAIRDKIFEPYFTTRMKGEGTGLGLSISQEIVEEHKGRIEVESVPGKTCFKVLLPITADIKNQLKDVKEKVDHE